MPTNKQLPDVLRAFIKADGRTRYQLWKDSGVDQAVLNRFMAGGRDLNLRTAGRLCAALGLELRKVRKATKPNTGKGR